MGAEEAALRLREALVDSTRHHLVADVPVGAFLSGGVDSSALLGLMAELHGGPIRTVTLCFDAPDLDESRLAAAAAQLYGAEHHAVLIKIEEIRERIPDAVRALDQPSIDGINTFFVAEATVRTGLKVAVSGVGGDELFGGYTSFDRIPRIRALHRGASHIPLLGRALEPAGLALERLPRTRRGSKLARALAFGGDDVGAYYVERGLFSPREVRELLAPELGEAVDACDPRRELASRVRLEALPPDERVSALEFRQYLEVQLLRDTDAVSMRHSLEVRTPLVDRELLRAAACVPPLLRRAGPAKRALREAPRPPVPPALWQRRKQGFTLPFEAWLRSDAVPLGLPQHPLLRAEAVERVQSDFRSGRLHWSRLWALLVLGEFLALRAPDQQSEFAA
jgi:asparagine synthase (glutamine-hydrolysing)